MSIILAFVVKYWREAVILIVLAAGVWWIRGKDVKIAELQQEIANKNATISQLNTERDGLLDSIKKQNQEIESWKNTSEETSRRLQDALNKPPRIIYRDRVVEVPSINTGPCEQVFVDLQHYIERLMQ